MSDASTTAASQRRQPPRRQEDPPPAKFIQIASGQPIGQGLTMFALDEAGDVWQIIPGREPEAWVKLPMARLASGRHASH